MITLNLLRGPGSSVGIATELRAGRSGDRIPVGRDFPPVQTGPGVHPASCTMGTGSFPRVKYGRGVLLTTHSLLVPRSWKSRAIPLTQPLGHNRACNGNTLPFTFITRKRGHLEPWKWNRYSLQKRQQQISLCCIPIQKGADLKYVASKAWSQDGVLTRLRDHGSLLWRGKGLISAKCPHHLWDPPSVLLRGHRQSFPLGKAAGR